MATVFREGSLYSTHCGRFAVPWLGTSVRGCDSLSSVSVSVWEVADVVDAGSSGQSFGRTGGISEAKDTVWAMSIALVAEL